VTHVLVHGGLWEDMDAERFWVRPGLVAGLAGRGIEVLAPDRVVRAGSWDAEVEHLRGLLPDGPVTLVGGSNGCSVAARIAVGEPGRVERLVLAWPATAHDPEVDAWTLTQGVPAGMLAGDTLRGLSDADLARLPMPVAVVPALGGPFHQRRTVDALLALIPGATELPGTPESPRPDFAPYRDGFVAAVASS
jgi:pimeloyl-ACP methyl ester carboxylesterase